MGLHDALPRAAGAGPLRDHGLRISGAGAAHRNGYGNRRSRGTQTSNVVESPFPSERLRTDAAKRFKKVANATALIWRLLRVAESRFRKLNAPHLVAQANRGVKFVNRVKLNRSNQRAAV